MTCKHRICIVRASYFDACSNSDLDEFLFSDVIVTIVCGKMATFAGLF